MTKFKRAFCGILAAFLIISCPVRSYAIGEVVAAATVGGFSIGAVLAACGIVVAGGAVAVLIGTWTDRDTYLLKGAAKELGVYAQRVYDGARSASQEIKEKYEKIEETLIACVTSSWGQVITGIRAFVADIKDFFQSSVVGFGTWLGQGQVWQVPAVPVGKVWGYTSWSTFDFYPLPTTGLVPSVSKSPDYTLFLTSYCVDSNWSPTTMNIRNMYIGNTALENLFGVYNVTTQVMTVYRRDPVNLTYKEYDVQVCSAYVNEDGTFKYNYDTFSYWGNYNIFCSLDVAGDLPFPVFSSLDDAKHYVTTGEKINLYVSGTLPLEVDGYREDIVALPDTAVSDTFTLPASKEEAAEREKDIHDIYITGTLADVLTKVKDGGLEVEIDTPVTPPPVDPDPPDDDKKKPAWLGWLIGEIGSWILGRTLDELLDWLLDGTREIKEDDSGEIIIEPVEGIKDKFPFCIPFDLIYLVQALEAESEVPRFEIPIDIDYEFIEYHETFVVDFYDWITVVNVLRAMLDIWFIAGLIVTTRNIMRG